MGLAHHFRFTRQGSQVQSLYHHQTGEKSLKRPSGKCRGPFSLSVLRAGFSGRVFVASGKTPSGAKKRHPRADPFGPAARSCGHMRGDERSSPYALRNASLSPREKSCRYKRRIAGARHARYHSWRNTKTQGYPPPVFSVRAGTRADRLRTNLRAREGDIGTLSAVLEVADRRGARVSMHRARSV